MSPFSFLGRTPLLPQRLDRVWYDFDGGYDDTNNPFASIPEEYTRKKEEKLAKTTVKKMSAQQRQINKVGGPWFAGWLW